MFTFTANLIKIALAGIYIHIPFCRTKCIYCNFFSVASLSKTDEFSRALCREIESRKAETAGLAIKTIYFGGGTPSVMPSEFFDTVLNTISNNYRLDMSAEITIEINPDDATPPFLTSLMKSGFNRISIGVQSFSDAELHWLGRSHSAAQSAKAIGLAAEAGFRNISADLIFGIPGQTEQSLTNNIEQLKEVQHVSCYALTVEDNTILRSRILKNQISQPRDEDVARYFHLCSDLLLAQGFEYYEISNYARPGFRSHHNENYWKGVPYVGFGPSAHSYNGTVRRWNAASVSSYLLTALKGNPEHEKEYLSMADLFNEFMMTGLRRAEGIDLGDLLARFGNERLKEVHKQAIKHLENGNLKTENNTLVLTREGRLFADGISASFFVTFD